MARRNRTPEEKYPSNNLRLHKKEVGKNPDSPNHKEK